VTDPAGAKLQSAAKIYFLLEVHGGVWLPAAAGHARVWQRHKLMHMFGWLLGFGCHSCSRCFSRHNLGADFWYPTYSAGRTCGVAIYGRQRSSLHIISLCYRPIVAASKTVSWQHFHSTCFDSLMHKLSNMISVEPSDWISYLRERAKYIGVRGCKLIISNSCLGDNRYNENGVICYICRRFYASRGI